MNIIINEPVKWPEKISDDFKSLLSGLLEKDPNDRIDWPDLSLHPFFIGNEEEGDEDASDEKSSQNIDVDDSDKEGLAMNARQQSGKQSRAGASRTADSGIDVKEGEGFTLSMQRRHNREGSNQRRSLLQHHGLLSSSSAQQQELDPIKIERMATPAQPPDLILGSSPVPMSPEKSPEKIGRPPVVERPQSFKRSKSPVKLVSDRVLLTPSPSNEVENINVSRVPILGPPSPHVALEGSGNQIALDFDSRSPSRRAGYPKPELVQVPINDKPLPTFLRSDFIIPSSGLIDWTRLGLLLKMPNISVSVQEACSKDPNLLPIITNNLVTFNASKHRTSGDQAALCAVLSVITSLIDIISSSPQNLLLSNQNTLVFVKRSITWLVSLLKGYLDMTTARIGNSPDRSVNQSEAFPKNYGAVMGRVLESLDAIVSRFLLLEKSIYGFKLMDESSKQSLWSFVGILLQNYLPLLPRLLQDPRTRGRSAHLPSASLYSLVMAVTRDIFILVNCAPTSSLREESYKDIVDLGVISTLVQCLVATGKETMDQDDVLEENYPLNRNHSMSKSVIEVLESIVCPLGIWNDTMKLEDFIDPVDGRPAIFTPLTQVGEQIVQEIVQELSRTWREDHVQFKGGDDVNNSADVMGIYYLAQYTFLNVDQGPSVFSSRDSKIKLDAMSSSQSAGLRVIYHILRWDHQHVLVQWMLSQMWVIKGLISISADVDGKSILDREASVGICSIINSYSLFATPLKGVINTNKNWLNDRMKSLAMLLWEPCMELFDKGRNEPTVDESYFDNETRSRDLSVSVVLALISTLPADMARSVISVNVEITLARIKTIFKNFIGTPSDPGTKELIRRWNYTHRRLMSCADFPLQDSIQPNRTSSLDELITVMDSLSLDPKHPIQQVFLQWTYRTLCIIHEEGIHRVETRDQLPWSIFSCARIVRFIEQAVLVDPTHFLEQVELARSWSQSKFTQTQSEVVADRWLVTDLLQRWIQPDAVKRVQVIFNNKTPMIAPRREGKDENACLGKVASCTATIWYMLQQAQQQQEIGRDCLCEENAMMITMIHTFQHVSEEEAPLIFGVVARLMLNCVQTLEPKQAIQRCQAFLVGDLMTSNNILKNESSLEGPKKLMRNRGWDKACVCIWKRFLYCCTIPTPIVQNQVRESMLLDGLDILLILCKFGGALDDTALLARYWYPLIPLFVPHVVSWIENDMSSSRTLRWIGTIASDNPALMSRLLLPATTAAHITKGDNRKSGIVSTASTEPLNLHRFFAAITKYLDITHQSKRWACYAIGAICKWTMQCGKQMELQICSSIKPHLSKCKSRLLAILEGSQETCSGEEVRSAVNALAAYEATSGGDSTVDVRETMSRLKERMGKEEDGGGDEWKRVVMRRIDDVWLNTTALSA